MFLTFCLIPSKNSIVLLFPLTQLKNQPIKRKLGFKQFRIENMNMEDKYKIKCRRWNMFGHPKMNKSKSIFILKNEKEKQLTLGKSQSLFSFF